VVNQHATIAAVLGVAVIAVWLCAATGAGRGCARALTVLAVLVAAQDWWAACSTSFICDRHGLGPRHARTITWLVCCGRSRQWPLGPRRVELPSPSQALVASWKL